MSRLRTVLASGAGEGLALLQTGVDWEGLGCELVGIACDAQEGWEVLLQQQPELLVTWVDLPGLSGLELVERLRPSLPNLKVIFLSESRDFEEVRRALRLGAADFLAKPFEPEELSRMVRRLAGSSPSQEAGSSQADRLQVKAQLLSLLTNMSHAGQAVHHMLLKSGLDSVAYYLMILQPEKSGALPQSSLNVVDSLLSQSGASAQTITLYDSVVIYLMRQDEGEGWMKEAKEICRLMREKLPIPLRIGISGLSTSKHQIRQTYQQARQALFESAANRRGTEYVFYNQQGFEEDGLMAEMTHQLDRLVEASDLTEESADQAAEELLRLSGQQYSQLRALVSLYALMLSKKYPCSKIGPVDRALSMPWFVTGENEVKVCLRELCKALREGRSSGENQYGLLTKNVLEYIHIHGAEKLMLSEVAAKYNVSANYLSTLVRRETGINFHDHVLNAKMEIARTMLADPRILVEEVAYAVGYSNYVTFYNTFKRLEHQTPTQYRNQLAKEG